ncbi:hypothetical protein BJX62DRAFT_243393 [Aspergillus germanicus]
MRFITINTVALVAMLSTPGLACKCFVNNRKDNVRTKSCCRQHNGRFRFGDDCDTSTSTNRFEQFRECCGDDSNCDWPRGISGEKRDAFEEDDGATVVVV